MALTLLNYAKVTKPGGVVEYRQFTYMLMTPSHDFSIAPLLDGMPLTSFPVGTKVEWPVLPPTDVLAGLGLL